MLISKTGTLFVIATPIGNLNDISPRALETLRTVDLIACEDTRHTGKLLNHFGIRKPLESYHDFNEEAKSQALVQKIADGMNIGLVSDAGTPAISDPGYRLVRLCREQTLPVIAIPGPCAAIAALSAAGIASDEFFFVGFLPSRKTARRVKLGSLRTFACTMLIYEAPHRIAETLEDIQEVLGDRKVCVARELTKIHEECVYGMLSEVRSQVQPIGEFAIVIEGATPAEPAPIDLAGLSRQQALKHIADHLGIPRRQLYDLLMKRDL